MPLKDTALKREVTEEGKVSDGIRNGKWASAESKTSCFTYQSGRLC